MLQFWRDGPLAPIFALALSASVAVAQTPAPQTPAPTATDAAPVAAAAEPTSVPDPGAAAARSPDVPADDETLVVEIKPAVVPARPPAPTAIPAQSPWQPGGQPGGQAGVRPNGAANGRPTQAGVSDPRASRPGARKDAPQMRSFSTTSIRPYMYNGTDARSDTDDDIVAIRFIEGEGWNTCSGVAVAPDTIVTAGHCACGVPESYTVVTGPDSKTTDTRRRLKVREIVPFPGYDCQRSSDRQIGLDIAMIRLANPSSDLERRVRAISLMAETLRANADALRVYGFGFTEKGTIGKRQEAYVPIATATCVGREWRRAACVPFAEFVLAPGAARDPLQHTSITDSCGGDSGGPVFLTQGNRAYLVGVVSRGLPDSPIIAGQPCGSGGIYSTIGRQSVISWLNSQGVRLCLRGAPCPYKTPYAP